MSQWGGLNQNTLQKNPPSAGPSPGPASPTPPSPSPRQPGTPTNFAQTATALETFNNERPPSRATTRERSDSRASVRPMSMIQTYQPPVMEVGQDTLPELQRIFTFLNSHSNKLYQEGYFLKFHDTDSRTSAIRQCLVRGTDSMQAAVQPRIESGKNTSSSSSAPSSRYGMRVRSIRQAEMPRSCRPLSTSQMQPSTWSVCSCYLSDATNPARSPP